MQAIQLTKYGKPEEGLRLAEIAEPGDPGSGQILIRVEYAPINDSDLLVASGLYAVQPKLPSVVGNEGAGKALTVGDGSYCQMLWMTAASGGVGLFHPIDKPHPGDDLREER